MAAGVVISAQAVVEILFVGWRSNLTVALRVFLMLAIALQFVFVRLALRRSAGAVLALFLFEGSAILASLAGTAAIGVRVGLAAAALAAIGLLAASTHAFPTPELPRT